MLSYQHGYHAGGPADVHKHGVLAALLSLLTRKPRPITYLESHAGRGLYDLGSAEALKTREAERGVGLLVPSDGTYWRALGAFRSEHGANSYPGSPGIALAMLRPVDRVVLCELHPGEHAALGSAVRGRSVEIHRRDGHEALVALCPPKPRRGLALIDPSYEVKTEYGQTAETALSVLRRWPEGVVAVWYPLLPDARHRDMVGALSRAGPGVLIDEARFAVPVARGMTGSGMAVLNPPFGLHEAIDAALAGTSDAIRRA